MGSFLGARQRIGAALAGESTGAEFVSKSADLLKLSRMPCEQLGWQIGGTGIKLTRASLGSDGTCGGTGGGAITCEGCAHALTSSVSSVSISMRGSNLFSTISGLLVKSISPRRLSGAELGFSFRCLGADLGQHHGIVGVHGSFSRVHTRQVPPAGQGQQGGDQAGGDVSADGDHCATPNHA
jgi:hypothetical protein